METKTWMTSERSTELTSVAPAAISMIAGTRCAPAGFSRRGGEVRLVTISARERIAGIGDVTARTARTDVFVPVPGLVPGGPPV